MLLFYQGYNEDLITRYVDNIDIVEVEGEDITTIVYSIKDFDIEDITAYNSILANFIRAFNIIKIIVLKASSKGLIIVIFLEAYRNIISSLYSRIKSIKRSRFLILY